jgi:hypothetical protein
MIPCKEGRAVLWAVFHGYLIIGRKNGFVTVIQVPGDVEPVTAPATGPEIELNAVTTLVGSEGTKKSWLL